MAILMKYMDLGDDMMSLGTAVRRGRPLQYRPVQAYAVKDTPIQDKPNNYIGADVALRFPDHHATRVWHGKVVGKPTKNIIPQLPMLQILRAKTQPIEHFLHIPTLCISSNNLQSTQMHYYPYLAFKICF